MKCTPCRAIVFSIQFLHQWEKYPVWIGRFWLSSFLYANVVLSDGTTIFQGICEHMYFETVASWERKYSIWSLLSLLSRNGLRWPSTMNLALECPQLVQSLPSNFLFFLVLTLTLLFFGRIEHLALSTSTVSKEFHSSSLHHWLLWPSSDFLMSSRVSNSPELKSFADHVHRRTGVDSKLSFLKFNGWCRQTPILRKWKFSLL